ncbi:MAG: NADH-quinone oxidoreductase subunit NuoF [Chloroflexi bacterium]|nr:NADH-quinone oxidoreductase subunit NuoF [Chloroflexota bacterium]
MLSDKAKAEIRALQARYPVPRSALGPALYVAQREAGWLPPDVLAEVAAFFDLDVTEVGEFASFYHMYNTHRAPGRYHIELCTNVPCMLRGSGKLAETLRYRLGIEFGKTTPDGLFTLGEVECLGACATAPMFSCTEKGTGKIRFFEELDTPEKVDAALALIASGHGFDTCERWPLGPFRHGGKPETNFLLARVDKPDSHKIETYLADGGYETAKATIVGGVGAIPQRSPQQVIDEMKAANVRGRGGAGFPAGQKWSFLPAGKYPRYLVVNADESEPGTFKDRMIMEYDPHQLVEGIILTCYAIESERAFIYVRGEYYFAAERLEGAIAEAKARGFLGQNVFGSGKKLEVVVHRGAGAYECGEETAQLTSLEGYRGHPRLKPPFPAVEGLYARPTIVNNVETIANVPHVLRRGADWYKQWGTPQSTGFRVFCLSGQVKYPGLYELPHGTSLRELIYDFGGGLTEDAGELKAVIPGGLSVQLLDPSQLDTPLDYENVAKQGSALGSAAVIVIGANQSLVEVARRTLAFYREESCGKCTPCREGAPWLEAILERIEHGAGRVDDIALMLYLADMIGGKSFCPFGYAAVWGLQSNLAKFGSEFDAAIAAAKDLPVIPVRPTYRPDPGVPSGVTEPSLPMEERYNAPTVKR